MKIQALGVDAAAPEIVDNSAAARLGRIRALLADDRAAIALSECRAFPGEKAPSPVILALEALSLFHLKRFPEAHSIASRATALDANNAEAQVSLGYASAALGRKSEALNAFDRAVALQPQLSKAHAGRGLALGAMGRTSESMAAYEQAARLDPGDPVPFFEAGHLMLRSGLYENAHAAFAAACVLKPDHWGALEGVAKTLIALNRHEEAIPKLAALRLAKPRMEYLQGLLFNSRLYCCDWTDFDSESGDMAARVSNGEPADMPWSFLAHCGAASLQRRCAEIYVHTLQPSTGPIAAREARRAARLRIGYVSADFRDHPVAHLLNSIVENHDRSRFEIIAFSLGSADSSPVRQRLERAFDEFIDVGALQDAAIAQRITNLSIDIAVDLGGHTRGSRPRVFARRPAPLQINFLGFPGTLGADFMDYIIADPIVIPAAQAPHYSEKIIYMPGVYLPGEVAPPCEAPPSRLDAGLPADGIVYGSFNAPYKLTPSMFAAWMQILRQVDGSVLWIGNMPAAARDNLLREARRHGLEPTRLIFAPRAPTHAGHIARLSLADLFLDSFPYNAHSSALDALSAAVPIVTMRGDSFASRVATSLLHAAGLDHLSVDSLDAYVRTAVELARTEGAVGGLKAHLRGRRDAGSLVDPQRYCRWLETAYTGIWSRYVNTEPPSDLWVPADAGAYS